MIIEPQRDRVPEARGDEGDAAWRTRNVGRVLFAAADTFAREKLRILRDREAEVIPQVQIALFQNLEAGGTRLTDLAARACMTKQSMSELVDKAEALDLVERRQDASDLRAKIVALTPRGLRLRMALRQGVAEAKRRLAEAVGVEFLDAMKARLDVYAARGSAPAASGYAGDRRGGAGLGRRARAVGGGRHVRPRHARHRRPARLRRGPFPSRWRSSATSISAARG